MTEDRSGRVEAPAGVPAAAPVLKLLNRESAILDFSRRVLAQARRALRLRAERLGVGGAAAREARRQVRGVGSA
jgi:hypothetical protein